MEYWIKNLLNSRGREAIRHMKSNAPNEKNKLKKTNKIKKITSITVMIVLLFQFGIMQLISHAAVIDCWTSYSSLRIVGDTITGKGYTTAASYTGKLNIQYDSVAEADNKDMVASWADTTIASPTHLSDTAMNVVMNSNAKWSVQNGANLVESTLGYVAATSYHVEIMVDMTTKKYSVWVTTVGSTTTTQIASNYSFRSDGAGANADDIGNVFFTRTANNATFFVTHHMIRPQISSSTTYTSELYSTSAPYSGTTYLNA